MGDRTFQAELREFRNLNHQNQRDGEPNKAMDTERAKIQLMNKIEPTN